MSMPEKERGCKNTGAVRPFFRTQYYSTGGSRRGLPGITAGHGKAYMEIDFFSQAQEFGSNGTQTIGTDIPCNGIELKGLFSSVAAAYNYRQRTY